MDIDSQPPEGTTQGSDAAAAALEEDRRQAGGNGQGPTAVGPWEPEPDEEETPAAEEAPPAVSGS